MPTSSRSNRRNSVARTPVSGGEVAFLAFLQSRVGYACLLVAGVVLLILVDLLLSSNRLSAFCLWIGAETLLGFILYWIFSGLLRGTKRRGD